jgi:surfeit locus 1 family protein
MKTSAETKLPKMAKKAIATMNFIRSIITTPRSRNFVWVTLALCVGVALTVRLGFWQLSRAQEKLDRHQAIAQQQAMPELDTSALLEQPALFASLHRRVHVSGRWLPQHTVYLDNRAMNGRAGFWVLTPLVLNANTRVLVQRGWVPRHQLDRTLLPPIDTPLGEVHVQGRLSPPPSELMQLGAAQAPDHPDSGSSRIRQNIELAQYASETGAPLVATVLQTGPASEGMLRDWPEISAGVEKHHAYAFQWFALAALQLMLYLWFQWITPYRHVRTPSI